jgi:DNA-binding transcriptional ArsR family regulator
MEASVVVNMLAALAQETRLAIYRLLVECGEEGLPAGKIGEELGLAAATLSFHLKELSHAGLIRGTQDGRHIYYAAEFATMNALLGFLSRNCCARKATGKRRGQACC